MICFTLCLDHLLLLPLSQGRITRIGAVLWNLHKFHPAATTTMIQVGIKGTTRTVFRQVRYASSHGYEAQLAHARINVTLLLEAHDRSSFILAQYVPEPARDAFLAVKGFALEALKITFGGSGRASKALAQLSSNIGLSTSDVKFKFWSDQLALVFSDPILDRAINEPIAFLIRNCLREGVNLDIAHFHQFLQTRKHFVDNKKFQSVEAICAYGEGTYSQMNYVIQGSLLLDHVSPLAILLLEYSAELRTLVLEIAAHLGQATAVLSMLLGAKYYGQNLNMVVLPEDKMTENNVSQEDFLRFTQGHLSEDDTEFRGRLKDVVYQTAITANDHMLTARQKFTQAREIMKEVVSNHREDEYLTRLSKKWRKGVPDVIFVPFMVGIPTKLYLRKLESADFDLMSKKLDEKEWRLAWRSYWDYHGRKI